MSRALALAFALALAACGGPSHAHTLDGGALDASALDSGSVALDAGPQESPDAGLPVSRCYDGWTHRDDYAPCHCVKACDGTHVYGGYFQCSLAPADNVPGPGNGAGTCLYGRCLDVPSSAACVP